MSYLVLARKWRPQTFDAITGQEHVTRTLTAAIEQDRVHHAFLFCGARGVGKTTAARVLARALNCVHGPTATPCGICEACVEIASSSAMDVFEIDGASNRGIGEIRELREGIAYAPQRDRHKIYIIDEVHMLTTEAFNALLKTLEEPPPHVKFIFATTEPQRIPVTILSRCQRFDFKRISLPVMMERLKEILKAEEVTIDDEALRLVCRESEGSMRDALSLLDRIISFCGKEASMETVASILGVADRAWLGKLIDAALRNDAASALEIVQDVFTYGVDLRQFSHDLVHYLRDIVVLGASGGKQELTDLAREETDSLLGLSDAHALETFERLLVIASRGAERLADAAFPRLELEMLVIRMCRLKPVVPIDRLIDRLAALERHLTTGAPLPEPPPTGTPTPPSGGPRSAASTTGATTAPPAPRGPQGSSLALVQPPMPAPSTPLRVVDEPITEVAEDPTLQDIEAPPPQPMAKATPEPPRTGGALDTPDTQTAVGGEAVQDERKGEVRPAAGPEALTEVPESAEAEPAEAEPVEAEPVEAEPVEAEPEVAQAFDQDDWERFVTAVRQVDPVIAASLDHSQVVSYDRGTLDVAVPSRSHSLATLNEVQGKILGRLKPLGVRALNLKPEEAVADTPFARRETRRIQELERRREALSTHPAVLATAARFGGEVTSVTLQDNNTQETEQRHER